MTGTIIILLFVSVLIAWIWKAKEIVAFIKKVFGKDEPK